MASDPIIPLVLGVGGGTYMFWNGFSKLAEYRVISNTPTSKVRSLSLGQVEVSGIAKEELKLLISPFSNTECVYFSYTVEERVQSGKKSHWKTVASDTSYDPFLLVDDTGKVLVIPFGADLRFKKDFTYKSNVFGIDPEFRRGLDSLGIDPGGLFFNKTMRCKETVVAPGDEIYVLGTAAIKEGHTGSEQNQDNLYIGASDTNYFIISDHSEKELISSSSITGYLMVIFGPVLTLTCLFFLLRIFKVL